MGLLWKLQTWFGLHSNHVKLGAPIRPASITPIARNRDLEAAIAEDRRAIEAYRVYADWLQERGDPRGELITLQIALAHDRAGASATQRERELWRTHGTYFCGPFANIPSVGVEFRYGFIWRIDLHVVGIDELLAALALDHPASRFVETIAVQGDLSLPSAERSAGLRSHLWRARIGVEALERNVRVVDAHEL